MAHHHHHRIASTKDFLTTFAASIAAEHAEDGINVLVVVSHWGRGEHIGYLHVND